MPTKERARVHARGRIWKWWFRLRTAHKLRMHARATYGRDGSLAYLEGLAERVSESGQSFYLIPGNRIIARAIKVERRHSTST